MSPILIILFASLTMATPLIIAALGGLLSEKSGVVNIGLEGMMTFGAFVGAVTIALIEPYLGISALFIGVLFGALGGMLFGWLHAYLTITLKIDQIISGTAINTITLALSIYLTRVLFAASETPTKQTNGITFFSGKLYLITIMAFILVMIIWYIMNRSRWGMHVQAVGENPQAADAMGINVIRTRYQAVLMSGFLAGIAGMAIVLTTTSRFSGTVISGKGFIALAVLIFGRWKPYGVLAAGLLFGFSSSLGTVAKVLFPNSPIPTVYFDILPYVITIIALVAFSRSTVAPSALGTPYDKEMR
jgi:ABC-type uncharacterized transport system permease subunit